MSCEETIKNIQENLKSIMEIFEEVKEFIPEETIEHFKLTSNEAIALGDKIIKNDEPTVKEFVSDYI